MTRAPGDPVEVTGPCEPGALESPPSPAVLELERKPEPEKKVEEEAEDEAEGEDGSAEAADLVMPLEGHLSELRTRIIRSLVVFVVAVMAAIGFGDQILWLLTRTSGGRTFIYLSPLEPVLVKLRMSILVGVLASVPYLLLEAWAFVRPGLKPAERRASVLFVPPILLCFAGGVAFAYALVLPYGLEFFIGLAGPGLTPTLSIAAYAEFALMLMLLFGVLFEVPLVMLFLARMGFIDATSLARGRPSIIVGIFVAAAVFSPPDVVSQFAVAIPLLVLFEVGLLGMRVFGR